MDGVKLASTRPLSSLTETVLPASCVSKDRRMLPWVESPPKFSAIPEAPAAMTVPPVMEALVP